MAKKDRHVAPETLGSFNLSPPRFPHMTSDERDSVMSGKSDTSNVELAQIVNVELTSVEIDIPEAMGLSKYVVTPFSISPPVEMQWAEALLKHSMERISTPANKRRLGETGKPTFVLLAPAEPPNFKKKSWVDPNSGRTFTYSQYRPKVGSLRPDGRQLYHSEEQAFFIVSKMLTTEAIQRYVRDFDSRPNVVNFAHTVINYRQEQQLQRAGVTSRVNRAVN